MNIATPATVEVERDIYIRFVGFALDDRLAGGQGSGEGRLSFIRTLICRCVAANMLQRADLTLIFLRAAYRDPQAAFTLCHR